MNAKKRQKHGSTDRAVCHVVCHSREDGFLWEQELTFSYATEAFPPQLLDFVFALRPGEKGVLTLNGEEIWGNRNQGGVVWIETPNNAHLKKDIYYDVSLIYNTMQLRGVAKLVEKDDDRCLWDFNHPSSDQILELYIRRL